MSKNLPAQRELTLPRYDGRRSLRDDMDIMALPFFASEKGPAIRYMRAQINTAKDSAWVEIKGNDDGIATMWDKRVLIHIRTMIDVVVRPLRLPSPSRHMIFSRPLAQARGRRNIETSRKASIACRAQRSSRASIPKKYAAGTEGVGSSPTTSLSRRRREGPGVPGFA